MPKPSKRIIWPAYIDAQKTRKQGRVISKKEAIGAPDIKEMINAARQAGLEPTYEEGKSFPRLWWERKGRILINAKYSKRQAIRQIAANIHSSRAAAL
ncbi:MAG: signal recognition particle subunit SRP19/SEC65 family protein [Halobacteriota archaeon]